MVPIAQSRRPERRKLLFSAVLVILLILSFEIASYGALCILARGVYSISEAQRIRRPPSAQAASERVALEVAPEIVTEEGWRRLHPFLGYVLNSNPEGILKGHVGALGFLGKDDPILRRDPSCVIVGIVGGSVAMYFSVLEGARELSAVLESSPEFAGREIVVAPIALGQMKQPQQLMAVNYLLALGAEFDIIVNLDGFNEIALRARADTADPYSPFYPFGWSQRVGDLARPEVAAMLGQIELLEEHRNRWDAFFRGWPWAALPSANLIWKIRRGRLDSRLAHARSDLAAIPAPAAGAAGQTEAELIADERTLARLADMWERASLQLHRLSAANDIDYFHFLQPNQYVRGSKRMGAAERKTAYMKSTPYRQFVENGYPLLLERGRRLTAEGVSFHDLTRIFAGRDEPTYSDTCCHLNATGNEILGREIARIILVSRANR